MKQYGLNSAEYIKCLFIDYLLSKDEDSIIGNEFMYGIKRKLVDLVVLKKHKTIAVEVKSNNDNLIRLEEQIKEYKKIFDYVLIVTTEKHKNNVIGTVSDDIGIYIVQDDSSIIMVTFKDLIINIFKFSPNFIRLSPFMNLVYYLIMFFQKG